MIEPLGFRGYIASRPILGERAPQHIQNLVVRDFAKRRNLLYLLSATEWAMDECHMILEEVLDELPKLNGVIAYSLFMLPKNSCARARIWDRFLAGGKIFYAALEGLRVAQTEDVRRIEDIWLSRSVLETCPVFSSEQLR